MENRSQSFSFTKWFAGIIAAIISALTIWLVTNYFDQPVIMKIEGIWKTPIENLSYKIIQHDGAYTWMIRESGLSGNGIIDKGRLVSDINGRKVVYTAMEFNAEGRPVVFSTTEPDFAVVVLFRTCDDFEKYLNSVVSDSPKMKVIFDDVISKLPNPTCPDIKFGTIDING